MRYVTEIIGKQIISMDNGRKLGVVKDLYLDADLHAIAGIFIGTEGLMRRKTNFIAAADVQLYGEDAVLVSTADSVQSSETNAEYTNWLRRDSLTGRSITTTGGSAVGVLGNLVVDEESRVSQIVFGRIDMDSPVTRQGFVKRSVVQSVGDGSSPMTIDLVKAEAQVQLTEA